MKKNKFFGYKLYALGEFVAKTMLHGIINPDMQLSNLGTRREPPYDFVFLDYPNVKKISLPDELNKEYVRQLTESLFPLLDDLKGDFFDISYFRAGFVSYGGYLGHFIFDNTIENGYSSFIFKKPPASFSISAFDSNDILDGFALGMIKEWQQLSLDDISIKTFHTLEQYNLSSQRQTVSPLNMYYMDILYFVRSFLALNFDEKHKKDALTPIAILCANWAKASFCYNLPYSAFGLFKKCLSMEVPIPQLTDICTSGISTINDTGRIQLDALPFIEQLMGEDLFSLLWILRDLDRSIATFK